MNHFMILVQLRDLHMNCDSGATCKSLASWAFGATSSLFAIICKVPPLRNDLLVY